MAVLANTAMVAVTLQYVSISNQHVVYPKFPQSYSSFISH